MDRKASHGELRSLLSICLYTSPLGPDVTAFSSCKAVEDTQSYIDQKINELEALITFNKTPEGTQIHNDQNIETLLSPA